MKIFNETVEEFFLVTIHLECIYRLFLFWNICLFPGYEESSYTYKMK